MNIEESLDYLMSTAKSKCDCFDALAGQDSSDGLSVFQGKVKDTEISNSVGVGIRVFKDGKPGYAFTERLTKEALDQMVADAVSHTAFTKPLNITLPKPLIPGIDTVLYHEKINDCSLDEMREVCLKLESIALKQDEIENVPYLGASRSESKVYLANSNGLLYSQHANYLSIGAGVVASRNDVKKLGVYNQTVFDGADFDPEMVAHKAVNKARSLLGAKTIATGVYPVILSEEISGKIINMYASCFTAESVQKGTSKLKGKLSEIIASPCFTLVNDPTRIDLPGYESFDSEGVPTKRMDIIANGKLSSYLYNLETAAIDGIESTGNASRSYAGKVGSGFQNLIVEPGGYSTDALVSLFPRAILITQLDGNTGCSAVSGELSIGAQGFYCENGEVIHPVEGLTLSTNFFDLLKNVEGVGSEYNEHYSSIRVPALAVSSIAVSN